MTCLRTSQLTDCGPGVKAAVCLLLLAREAHSAPAGGQVYQFRAKDDAGQVVKNGDRNLAALGHLLDDRSSGLADLRHGRSGHLHWDILSRMGRLARLS